MKFDGILEKGYLKKLNLLVLAVILAGSALSSGYFFLQTHISLDTHYGAVLSLISDYKSSLIAKSFTINISFFVLIIIGIVVLGILYSHKITGPLHRIKMYAKTIGEGNLGNHVGFRSADVIHPFAESINKLTDNYNTRLEELASETNKLREAATELKSLTEDGKDIDAALQKTIEADNEIRKLLEGIRV